jgi:hypothetical protein
VPQRLQWEKARRRLKRRSRKECPQRRSAERLGQSRPRHSRIRAVIFLFWSRQTSGRSSSATPVLILRCLGTASDAQAGVIAPTNWRQKGSPQR